MEFSRLTANFQTFAEVQTEIKFSSFRKIDLKVRKARHCLLKTIHTSSECVNSKSD